MLAVTLQKVKERYGHRIGIVAVDGNSGVVKSQERQVGLNRGWSAVGTVFRENACARLQSWAMTDVQPFP